MPLVSGTPGILAGFHVLAPSTAVPEVHAVGDEWIPEQRPMAWHAHPVWEIQLQISGEIVRRSSSHAWPMHPGDAFISPPGARHRVVNRGTAQHHYRFVRFALEPVLRRHRGLAPHWSFAQSRHLPGAWTLDEPFAQLLREVSWERPLRDEGLRLALDTLVVSATRLLSGGAVRALMPVPQALLAAQALLENACEQPWPLRALADRVHLSPSHLVALFRQHLGVSPHRFLLQRRIERARRLLEQGDAPITAIALEVGFATSQHFAKAFRAATGRSAREHRRLARTTMRAS